MLCENWNLFETGNIWNANTSKNENSCNLITLARMKSIVIKVEALHGIFYILETINGNHILIIDPPKNHASYYCWKGF
jgi:hypothetical protein